MIIRKNEVSQADDAGERSKEYGQLDSLKYSSFGGLSHFGAYLETLEPGSRSSDRHWHEEEDEFLFVVSGDVTVVENDGEHQLKPGDAACWPAGVPNAHHVLNRSNRPCSYLIVGDRPSHDVCHYPDLKRRLHTEGDTWRIVTDAGDYLAGGKVKPYDA